MEDNLIVTYDCRSIDEATLFIARKDGEVLRVLNTFQGDEAFGIYHYLTGGTYLKSARDIPIKVVCDGNDESDYVHCPRCNACIGVNDMVYDKFYYRDWKPIYCVECGQAMFWK